MDAVDFLRLQVDPQGLDYSRKGSRNPVCNHQASQMVIFDPQGDGFYLALGVYYAAHQNIYHIFSDFSRKPELFRPGLPMPPAVVERARIENLLISKKERRDSFVKLAQTYKDEAQIQFLCAYYSYLLGELPQYAVYAHRASELDPQEAEYLLYLGLAAHQNRDFHTAIQILEKIKPASLYRRDQVMYQYILFAAWQQLESKKAEKYRIALDNLLAETNAGQHFEKSLLPLIERQV